MADYTNELTAWQALHRAYPEFFQPLQGLVEGYVLLPLSSVSEQCPHEDRERFASKDKKLSYLLLLQPIAPLEDQIQK